MICPCDIDGFCPYSTDPTPNTCDVFCDYPDNTNYDYEVDEDAITD